MTLKRLEIFVIVAIIAAIGIIYAFTQRPALAPVIDDGQNQNQNQGIAVGEPNPSTPVEYKGIDGKNALELLQASYHVEVQHYSFGDLVKTINGITPDANHFWAMYVNGQFSQVGASTYITKSGDSISWKLEEVKP